MQITQVTSDVISTNTISGLIQTGFGYMNVVNLQVQTVNSGAANNLTIQANNSTVATITSSGYVGIGTANPGQTLTVNGNTSILAGNKLFFWDSTNTYTPQIWANGNNLLFAPNSGTEAMRIDSSGNVGIGTNSPSTYGLFSVYDNGTGTSYTTATVYDHTASPGVGKNALLVKSRMDGSQANFVARFQANDGSTEAMAITTGGKVGIGTSSPNYSLDVQATSGAQIARFGATTSTNQSYITVSNSAVLYLGLDNSTGTAITNNAYGAFLYTSANAPISFHNNGIKRVEFDTSGNINLRTSGGGITFSNASALTNSTLNDYETGTWSPGLTGSTTNPTITSGTIYGKYVKVGKMVTIWFEFPGVNMTGGSGQLSISNLPFTVSTQNGDCFALYETSNLFPSGRTMMGGYTTNGASTLTLFYWGGSSATSTTSFPASTSSINLYGTISYLATF
jgi:hypothetical protein